MSSYELNKAEIERRMRLQLLEEERKRREHTIAQARRELDKIATKQQEFEAFLQRHERFKKDSLSMPAFGRKGISIEYLRHIGSPDMQAEHVGLNERAFRLKLEEYGDRVQEIEAKGEGERAEAISDAMTRLQSAMESAPRDAEEREAYFEGLLKEATAQEKALAAAFTQPQTQLQRRMGLDITRRKGAWGKAVKQEAGGEKAGGARGIPAERAAEHMLDEFLLLCYELDIDPEAYMEGRSLPSAYYELDALRVYRMENDYIRKSIAQVLKRENLREIQTRDAGKSILLEFESARQTAVQVTYDEGSKVYIETLVYERDASQDARQHELRACEEARDNCRLYARLRRILREEHGIELSMEEYADCTLENLGTVKQGTSAKASVRAVRAKQQYLD